MSTTSNRSLQLGLRAFATVIASLAAFAPIAAAQTPPTNAPPTNAPTTAPAVSLPRSTQFDLQAPNGLTYRIFVAAPEAAAPADGYATYFVLDGNAMFGTVVDAVRFQKGIVPTLVVGVGYPGDAPIDLQRRYYDFSPLTPPEQMWESGSEPRAKPAKTGGQDEFLDFLDTTLRPALESRYKLNANRRTLFGHSLAGRFVLHALFTRPALFTHYVAASPSIWWNERSVLGEAQTYMSAGPTLPPRSLLITAAELEEKAAPGTTPERIRFFEMARMVSSARELSASLQPLAEKNRLRTTLVEYADENHGSVVPFAISRSIRFALRADPPASQPAR